MKPESRIVPEPGQESVWDYPRPPRLEPARHEVRVVFAGIEIVRTRNALRVLETSHPPVYYIPRGEILQGVLRRTRRQSFCEFKGLAEYYDLVIKDRAAQGAAWSYPDPVTAYAPLAGHIAFYPSRVDACFVGEERVTPQAGDFYGGWITSDIVGPFKGQPGTGGW